MTITVCETREEWLAAMADMLSVDFAAAGAPLPSTIQYSCSHMSSGSRSRAIGECYQDGNNIQIAIRPSLHREMQVAEVLVHELVHAAVGVNAGHRAPFQKVAKALGLVAPWTATVSTERLREKLFTYIAAIGPYPHKRFDAVVKKQHTPRHKNVNCPQCGFHAKVRVDQMSWGRLTCPAGCIDDDNAPKRLLTKEEGFFGGW